MTDASSSLVTKVDQLDTDTNAFLREVGANTAGIDKALKDNESNLAAIDNSYANIRGHTVQAQLAAERTEAFSEAKSLRQAMHLAVAPRPDLWLPLVSNLKLREGFGDVSFSRSTTATYVNKSGQLVTAQANEPRFEREGLLVEGGSTNLLTKSNERTAWVHGDGRPTEVESSEGGQFFGAASCKVKFKGPEGRGKIERQYQFNPVSGDYYTGSMWIKGIKGQTTYVGLNANKGVENAVNKITLSGGWQRVSATCKVKDTTGHTMYPHIRGNNTTTATDFEVACVQLEKLPFATSYIPTADKTVSRAGDYMSLSSAGENLGRTTNPLTMAFTVHQLGQKHGERLFYFGSPGMTNAHLYEVNRPGENYLEVRWFSQQYHSTLPLDNKEYTFVGVAGIDGIDWYYNGGTKATPGKYYPLGDGIITEARIGASFAHFRNLRVWQKALTPEQIAFL